MKAHLRACSACGSTEFYDGKTEIQYLKIKGKLVNGFTHKISYMLRCAVCGRPCMEDNDFIESKKTMELTEDETKAMRDINSRANAEF